MNEMIMKKFLVLMSGRETAFSSLCCFTYVLLQLNVEVNDFSLKRKIIGRKVRFGCRYLQKALHYDSIVPFKRGALFS